jgi:hypothetical protein
MQISYEYKIIDVDEESRTMTVEYISPGREKVLMGMPTPFEGEVLEEIIKDYAPIQHWLDLEKELNPPLIGTYGSILQDTNQDSASEEAVL